MAYDERLKVDRKSEGKLGKPDWSDLPIELWELVAKRLYLADYHNFGAVCSTWRSIVQERRHYKFPWIVLSDVDENHGGPNAHPFWILVESKVCRLQVPELRGKRCCGSSHGWLITASENSDSFHLLNPFSRVQILLPPPSAFPYTQYSGDPDYPRNRYFIHKAIVSSDPATSSEYTVMAIYSDRARLAFFKSGTERWIHVKSKSIPIACRDLLFHNNRFYGSSNDGRVVVCHLEGDPRMIQIAPSVNARGKPKWQIESHHTQTYLVESSGDLLQVWRMYKFIGYDVEDETDDEDEDLPYQTFAVKVFKIDQKSKGGRVEITSVGNDTVLFLGQNSSSISLSVKDFPGLKGNRIYFTDDYWQNSYFHSYGCTDYVVYDLEDGSLEPYLPSGLTHKASSPPIWILPNPG